MSDEKRFDVSQFGDEVKRILVVAAHPDDLETTSGGTLALLTGRGIEVARGDYLTFLDNDTAVRTRPWLTGLRRALETDESAGIVSPKLVFPFPPYPIECAGCAVEVFDPAVHGVDKKHGVPA